MSKKTSQMKTTKTMTTEIALGKIEMTISELMRYSSDLRNICIETHAVFPQEAILKLTVMGLIDRADKALAKIEKLDKNGFDVGAYGKLVNRRHIKQETKQ